MACGGRVKLSDFWLNHGDASVFAKSQWPIHRFIYPAWRVFLALYLLGWLIFRLAIEKNFGGFFVFLTDWTFLVLTLYAVSSCIGVIYFTFADRSNRFYSKDTASQPENVTVQDLGSNMNVTSTELPTPRRPLEGAVRPPLPHYFKFVWVLFNICLAVDPIITVVYWSFLAPQEESGLGLALDIHFHALNTVFIYADLLVSAIPVRVVHSVYPFLYGTVYISFTLIYFWSGGVNPYSGETAIYPGVLDWSQAGWTVLSCVVISITVPLIHLFGYGVYRLRVYIHKRYFGRRPEENCNLTTAEETPDTFYSEHQQDM
ncbi:protein rolling stone-like [Patiria miniata]|uniref:Protein rolling stone n=1 Tax=Patiria miniata TaxID=46514 RepID=A0A913ZX03_PATMI|nr:protein rolling stone-like [Patiria miniata]